MPLTSTSDNLDTTLASRELIAEITLTDPDDPTSIFGMNVLTATDDRFVFVYTNRYEPVAGQNTYRHFYDLFAIAGAVFDHETESMVVFTIYANSNPGIQENDRYPHNSVSATFTLTVADVNERPTDITLEDAVDDEITKMTSNDAGGIKIGQLGGVDPDAVDDVNGKDPDRTNYFSEFEFMLDQASSDGIDVRTDDNGDSFVYLSKTASELRYVSHLVARIEIKDNPGADENERLNLYKNFTINLDHPLTVDIMETSVSMNEDGQLIFDQAHGNAISIYGLDGETATITISVSHGKLSTGGQVIGSFATESVANSAGTKHQLTFTGIGEHDLTALLEGLVYSPDADVFGTDTLTISVMKGTERVETSIAITIDAVDDAPQIVNFGNVVRYQDNAGNFVLRSPVGNEYINKLPTTLTDATLTDAVRQDIREGLLLKEVEDIAAITLSAEGNARIKDDDGYTVANGKLYFRVIESVARTGIAPYDENVDYIKLRTSLGNEEAGVYLDGLNLKYRSDASITTADVIIGSLAKQENTGNLEYGDFLVEYVFTFSARPQTSTKTEPEWEIMLEDALDNLLNVVESDPTSQIAPAEFLAEIAGTFFEKNDDYGSRKLADILQKTLITARFEDGETQVQSDQEGVLVLNDQRFNDFSDDNVVIYTDVLQYYEVRLANDFSEPLEKQSVIAENIVDALVGKDQYGNNTAWDKSDTATTETTDGLLTLRYYFATTDSDVSTLNTRYGYPSVFETGKITTSLERKFESALVEIAKVANIKFVEHEGDFDISQVDLVFSSIIAKINIAGLADLEAKGSSRLGWVGVIGNVTQGTVLHEVLHLLGLRHPGLQQGNEDLPYLSSDQAIYANTAMAYSNKYGDYYPEPTQPQLYDIDALKELYGLNGGALDGDDSYDFKTSIDPYVTIYDRGGTDELDFNSARFSQGITLDLTPGTRSSLKESAQNASGQSVLADVDFVIARQSVLENVIGTPRDDHIYGNDADNQLEGGAGADLLDGRDGEDTVSYKLSGAGVNVDLSKKKQAVSTTQGDHSSGDTLISIEHIIGSDHNDVLIGNRDRNRIEGGKGDDTLTGDGGKDIFVVRFALDASEPERDTITDFQPGVDKLKIQTIDTMLDLEAAFTANQIRVKKDGLHTLELYLASNDDHAVAVTFVDAIDLANAIDFDGFTDMLLGDVSDKEIGNHFQVEVI